MRNARKVVTVAVLLAACSQAIAVDQAANLPQAARDLLQVYPGARVHQDQGQVRIIYGVPMGGGITPRDSATLWLQQNAAAFGCGHLELEEVFATPVMDGRFTAFGYAQKIDGVPVELGIARVLVLNGPANQVVYAAGNLAPRFEGGLPRANVDARFAQRIAAGDPQAAGMMAWGIPEPTVFHGNGDWVAPVLTWKVLGQGGLDNAKTFFVDAATGQVVFVRSEISDVNVNGTVKGWASSNLYPPDATYAPAALSLQPIPELRARIVGGITTTANRDGEFILSNAGATPVTVESGTNNTTNGLGGQWVNVVPADGAPTQIASESVTPPGPADLILNPGGTTDPANNPGIANLTAQINVAIGTDVTHNYIKDRAPAFTPLDIQIRANTGVAGQCNAFYSSANQSINFYNRNAANTCANTAYTTVISHEYGHFIVNRLGLAQQAFGEGYGDTVSEMIWDDVVLGRGFTGTQASFVRNPLTANIQYPCTAGAIHTCGQMLGGVWWRIRLNMGALMGSAPGLDATRTRQVAWSLMTTGGESQFQSIGAATAIQVLTVDDDDGNINNGTPHYSQICSAFSSHSVSCPALQFIAFQYPSGHPAIVPVGQSFSFPVNVVGISGTPQPGTGALSYRIGSAGAFTTVPMTQGAPNQYTATLPAAACLSRIEYYVSAQSTSAGTQTDPANAPASSFSTSSATSLTALADHNFQSAPAGWTVVTTATTGQWERAVPVTPPPTGCPAADHDGSGMCWVTDNRVGNFDVDNGTTTLTTGIYDLTGFTEVELSYSRWFYNATSLDDTLRLEYSTNGGTTWSAAPATPIDSTTVPNGNTNGWQARVFRLGTLGIPFTSQFRLRFHTGDLGSPSVTEAAIDAFKLTGLTCGGPPVCYANCDESTAPPILNVSDFGCFLTRYAAGEAYANCDESTTPPILNVSDFGCFLTKYAAGCP
ncbi:MAG: hypothetical protein WD749_01760 [Phycisphaerales bacterium]